MSLYLELGPGAVWSTVTGEPYEISMLESTLNGWAAQLGGRPAWVRTEVFGEDSLLMLGGIVPILPQLLDGMVVPESPRDEGWVTENVAAFGEWLWAHQAEAIKSALLAPAGRAIIEVPTGGGKTRIAAALGAAGGGRWLYVVPNRELLAQAEGTFAEASEIQGDSVEWHTATYSQLYDGGDPGVQYMGVVFDECHRIAADTWALGAASIHGALYRIGLSGTPLDRTDDKNTVVVGLTGPIVFRVDLKHLQELGRLAKGEVEYIKV